VCCSLAGGNVSAKGVDAFMLDITDKLEVFLSVILGGQLGVCAHLSTCQSLSIGVGSQI